MVCLWYQQADTNTALDVAFIDEDLEKESLRSLCLRLYDVLGTLKRDERGKIPLSLSRSVVFAN
jgi:hypothetical protein